MSAPRSGQVATPESAAVARAGSDGTRSSRVAADLRRRIETQEWDAGERLPGEHDLAEYYSVSRATVRTALQDLESRGITLTVHGRGTLVTANAPSVVDLRRLESMTEIIRRQGCEPSVRFRSITVRPAADDEAMKLQLSDDAEVLATERAILADGDTVAFSYDAIPIGVLRPSFDVTEVQGSLFSLLNDHGVNAVVALTEIHAAHGTHIGWGDRGEDPTYLMLEQLHSDSSGRGVAFARTYFVEGQLQFGLVRHT